MSDAAGIENILSGHPQDPRALVEVLQDVQRHFRYLPKDALRRAAKHLGVPLARVYGVATFYKAFSLVPRGKHLVRVCMGTACHVRGAHLVVEDLNKHLGIDPGETSSDLEFTLEAVNCVGACALAPVVMVDEEVHGAVTPGGVAELLPEAGK